jgi:hypothetical protein
MKGITLHRVHGTVRFVPRFPIDEIMADLWRIGVVPCVALWAVLIVKVVL